MTGKYRNYPPGMIPAMSMNTSVSILEILDWCYEEMEVSDTRKVLMGFDSLY